MSDATFDNIIASNATVNVKLLQMNYSEKISVIVPVYNTEKYLEASLRSVMNQTYKNLEIICVNDGSTDSSPAILQRLAAEDSRIRIINQDNAGQGAARNAGLAVATSEWITFPDSDDQLVPDAYETVVKSFELNPDMVHFSIKVVYEDGFSASLRERDRKYYSVKGDGLFNNSASLIFKSDCHVNNKFFRRSIIDKFNLRFPCILYEDFPFSKQYMLVSHNVFRISRPLYKYYRRSDSIMGTTFRRTPKSIDHLKAYQELSNFMQTHTEEVLRKKIEPIYFVQYYNMAIKYSDDATIPMIVSLADSIYYNNHIIQKMVVRKFKNETLTFTYKGPFRILKNVIEFIFSIKYESFNYKAYKIVRFFGFTLMKKPASC